MSRTTEDRSDRAEESLKGFEARERRSGVTSRLATVSTAVFVCLLLVSASVGAGLVAGAPDATAAADDPRGEVRLQVDAPENDTDGNETDDEELTPVPVIDHEDPRTALGRESARPIATYLVNSMSNRLTTSARLLDQAEYTEAQAELGEEYTSLFRRYDDVRGEVGTSAEEAERFALVRDEQIRYIQAVQTYRLTRQRYLESRRSADAFRSRALARDLELQAEAVLDHRDNLIANYTQMTEMPPDRRNETMELVNLQATRVTSFQEQIRADEFISTRLEVQAPNTTGSFAYPYRLFGTVVTLDGEPLANTSGQLIIGSQRRPVQTDANGTFETRYRPSSIAEGVVTVEVRFFVDEESAYLGDRTEIELFVNQVTPTITVETTPNTVGYRDEVTISGRVGAEVPNATLYQQRLENISQYRNQLRAARLEEARAAAAEAGINTTDPQNETYEPIEINETAIETAPLPPRLTEPVPTEYAGASNVTAVVAIGDRRLGTVETGVDGRYSFTAEIPADIQGGSQPVRVSLLEPDRALAPTMAETTMEVQLTPTRTTLEEVTTRGQDLFVAGQLTTESGEPLADRQIQVRFDGGVVETVRTTEAGGFAASVPLPFADESRSQIRVVAGFDTPTTNLRPSRTAATVVTLPEQRGEVTEEVPVIARLRELLGIEDVFVVLPVINVTLSPDLLAGLAAAVVVVLGVLFAARRRRGSVTTAGRRRIGDAGTESLLEAGRPDPADVTDTTPPSVYLTAAREALSNANPRLATEYAYVAVRRQLSSENNLPTRVTHREFLQAVRDGGYDVDDLVSTLTEAYERAAFSARGGARDEAERALTIAERIVD